MVGNSAARDGHKPAGQRPLVNIEPMASAPGANEHRLGDIGGVTLITGGPPRHSENQGLPTQVDLFEGNLIAYHEVSREIQVIEWLHVRYLPGRDEAQGFRRIFSISHRRSFPPSLVPIYLLPPGDLTWMQIGTKKNAQIDCIQYATS
jgi:hypothetical protein